MTTLLFLLALISVLAGLGLSTWQTIHASEDKLRIEPLPGIVGIVLSALFFSLYLGAYSVDAGSIGVVKHFGKITGMVDPGLHFVQPIGGTITSIPVQRRVIKTSEPASTSDLQIVNAEVTIGYHVDAKYADFILGQLNDDAEQRVIVPAALEAIKAETAQYEAQGLMRQREQVRAGIENRLRSRLALQHVILEDTSITNLSFSGAYEAAIEAKQVAEQNAEQQRNKLEQTKVEAEQNAAQAKGEADARVARANGEAQAILVEAQAKAKAQELLKQSLTPELLELRRIEMWNAKWDGSVPQFLGSGSNFLMQMPQPHGKTEKKGDNQ